MVVAVVSAAGGEGLKEKLQDVAHYSAALLPSHTSVGFEEGSCGKKIKDLDDAVWVVIDSSSVSFEMNQGKNTAICLATAWLS